VESEIKIQWKGYFEELYKDTNVVDRTVQKMTLDDVDARRCAHRKYDK